MESSPIYQQSEPADNTSSMIAKLPKPVVAVLDPYHPDAIKRLETDDSIELLRQEDGDRVFNEADAVMLRSETHLGALEFQRFKKLKFIVKQGVGVDNVDLEAAKQVGIEVYNTPGLNSEAVAELALSLALCLARRVCEFDRAIRDGRPAVRSQMLGRSLFGKVLGVVGMGNIGLELARKWNSTMGGKVVAYDPYYNGKPWSTILPGEVQQVESLDTLLREADVVSLHVPLTKSTRNMMSTTEFQMMKENSILLNCARGGIVDEDALLRALQSGKLAGAGLDAVKVEPPTSQAYADLLSNENVIITPHVGASTVENQSRSGIAVVEIVLDLLQGKTRSNRVA